MELNLAEKRKRKTTSGIHSPGGGTHDHFPVVAATVNEYIPCCPVAPSSAKPLRGMALLQRAFILLHLQPVIGDLQLLVSHFGIQFKGLAWKTKERKNKTHDKVFKNAIPVLQDYRYQGILYRMIFLGPVQVGCYFDYIKKVGPEATIFNKRSSSCPLDRLSNYKEALRLSCFQIRFVLCFISVGSLGFE